MSLPEPTLLSAGTTVPPLSQDPLLAGLTRAQLEAVLSEASPLCILAGAGSGKTRVLTRRIAHRQRSGTVAPQHTVAVTFTRKAALELRHRLRQLGLREEVRAGTFHSLAFAQLRQRWAERGIEPPGLLERKVGFVARLLNTRDRTLPLDVVGEIEWAKARRVPADGYPAAALAAGRRSPADPALVAEAFARYEKEKLQRRLVDFDDLLRLATRDLTRDSQYAAARRWMYRHYFVDEFQDLNPLQYELLRAWMGEGSDLCVVGDPNQAIYAWNGADASYLRRFEDHFPGGAVVELRDNFRSTPQVLEVAAAILPEGRLRATRPPGALPRIRRLPDERAEARSIARTVRDRHGGGSPWSAQAVLVRTNAQLQLIEEAFRAAKIPFRSRSGGSLLDQPEVKDALGRLRSERRNLASWVVDTELRASQPGGEHSVEPTPLDPTPPGAAADPTPQAGATDGEADPIVSERSANLAELARLGQDYLALDPTGNAAGFTSWLRSTVRADEPAGDGDAVDLATFHGAKGLEWPIVHLAGLERGLVPISYANTPAAEDEERRLLYVAITRARDELWCSLADKRTFGTKSVNREPSPWLSSIEAGLTMMQGFDAVAPAPSSMRRQRPSLKAPDPEVAEADRPLFEALRTWRAGQAKLSGAPAYVIFSDAVLRSLSAHRPSDGSSLLDISGIGPVKAEKFGADILRIVADHPRS